MFRTKTDVATDKAGKQTKKARKKAKKNAKKVGKTAAARGEAVKGSVLSATASALHSLSDSMAPKAAAAAGAAKGGASNAKSVALDKTADARAATMDKTADARAAARERATQARESAVSGLDRGVDAAVPVMQQGVSNVSDKVDHARDRLVDDVLPKLQEMLSNAQSSKDDALAKPDGAVATVTGAPKKSPKKGGFLIVFGILAAIGAGVAYYLSQQKSTSEDDTDPWAGSAASGTPSTSKNAVAQTTATGPVKTPAEATERADVNTDGATAVAHDVNDTHVNDTSVNDTSVKAGTTSTNGAIAEKSEIKEDEELPVMIDVDDVPGADPDAQAGFGTDFSDADKPGEGKHRA